MNKNSLDTTRHDIDAAHLARLSRRDQEEAREVSKQFLTRIERMVDTTYLHLDVDEFKEQTRSVPAFRWRANLMTNKGRYHADAWAFGAVEALKSTLEKLEEQLTTRIGKLEEARVSV